MTDHLISIILPVHNQGDHLGTVVEEYEETLANLQSRHELILVPNACRDNSVAICRQLAERYPNLRVIASERGGWGLAVKLGLCEARGDILCYTNIARTSTQDLMLHLLFAQVYPDVVVKANRKIRDNWRRRLGSLLYNIQCRTLFDLSYWDINGTPKVFPRHFARLLELQRDDDLIDAEFNVVCRHEDYPVIEIPIFATKRHGGKSTTNYRSAANMYWGAFKMWRALQKDGT